MKNTVFIAWSLINGLGSILGIVGYFRQYPLKSEINMNTNEILITVGIICVLSQFVLWTRHFYFKFKDKMSRRDVLLAYFQYRICQFDDAKTKISEHLSVKDIENLNEWRIIGIDECEKWKKKIKNGQ